MDKYIKIFNKYIDENQDAAISSFKEIRRITLEEDMLKINNSIPIFPRPGLIDSKTINEIGKDSEEILKIITSLPERIFAGDLSSFCSYLGFSDLQYNLISKTFGDNIGLMSRADLFFEKDFTYKFLEFNVDSSVGGLEIAAVNKVMENIDFYKEWIKKYDFQYDDPLLNFVNMIKEIVQKKGIEHKDFTIAVIDWHTYMDGYMWSLNLIKQYLLEANFRVVVCNQKDVKNINGALYHEGEKIDLVYRVFLGDDALENPEELIPILTAYEQEKVILINGVHTEIYSNKVIFALLSDPQYEKYYTKEEQILINKCIPMTRILNDEITILNGESINLIEYITENKNNLVIKPAQGYGGENVLLGWNMPVKEWKESIIKITNSKDKYIVQEKVNPVIEQMPLLQGDNLVVEDSIMNWGIYVFDGKYSGAMIRGLSSDEHGVINAAKGASMTCVFSKSEE